MAAWGLYAEKPVLPEHEPFYLWPQNLDAWNLFMGVQTQWRIGLAGREGLHYPGVEIVMARRRVRRRLRDQRFAEIQAMERAALTAWAAQKQ